MMGTREPISGCLSMQEVARGVEVVAMADGVVKARRDGMADRLVSTDEDRQAVSSRECGNGLILDHGNGFETQYCHLRKVRCARARREGGARAMCSGSSGLPEWRQFPHVHVTLRRNGKVIDPFTGLGIRRGLFLLMLRIRARAAGWMLKRWPLSAARSADGAVGRICRRAGQ
jgi:hypothetical protein